MANIVRVDRSDNGRLSSMGHLFLSKGAVTALQPIYGQTPSLFWKIAINSNFSVKSYGVMCPSEVIVRESHCRSMIRLSCFICMTLKKTNKWTYYLLQVINAALALAAKPQSKLAQENMDLFKEQWEKQVRVLTDAVDDITSIDDFLAVSGNELVPQRNI